MNTTQYNKIITKLSAIYKAMIDGSGGGGGGGGAITNPNIDTNLDVPLSTLLKPADTLTKVSTVDTITNVVKVSDNGGSLTVDNTNLDIPLSILNTSLQSILTELNSETSFEESVWIDSITNVYYVRTRVFDESTGLYTVTWSDIVGVTVTPTIANLVQVKTQVDYETISTSYIATVSDTDYDINDLIFKVNIINTTDNTVTSLWVNQTTDSVITAPVLGNLQLLSDTTQVDNDTIALLEDIKSNTTPTVDNSATEATLNALKNKFIATGNGIKTQTVLTDESGTAIPVTGGLHVTVVDSTGVSASPMTDTQGASVITNTADTVTGIGTKTTASTFQTGGTGMLGFLSDMASVLRGFLTASTAQFSKITDGTNTAVVKASSTAPALADPALVVSMSGNGSMYGALAPTSTPTRMEVTGGTFNSTLPTFTNGQSGALQVDDSGRLITSQGAGNFILVGANNTTTTQLAAGATTTGTITSALSYPTVIISANSNLAYTLVVEQFDDLAGTKLVETITKIKAANISFNEPVQLSGSYFRVKITNNGAATTTGLYVSTYLGVMNVLPSSLSTLGNLKVSLQEPLTTLGNVKVALVEPIRTGSTTANSSIVTGGVSQIVVSGNTSRNFFEIFNTSNATLYLSFGVAATILSIPIPAGGSYYTSSAAVPIGAINILGATTGQTFCYNQF